MASSSSPSLGSNITLLSTNLSQYSVVPDDDLEEVILLEQLDCPVYTDEEKARVDVFSVWCEGVLITVIAVFGLLGNTVATIILSKKSMRNSFNLLLIALAIYDNIYLVGGILESCRKRFHLVTNLHLILFPYFLYPLHMIAMTGSILMTVAIALERYVAVHYPINYSQAMNDSRALRSRMAKYLLPVVFLSLAMNVTKFFEITLEFVPSPTVNGTAAAGSAELHPVLNITELRMNPTYSIYFNWFRFISIGIIPFALLVFFNFQIYMDIRKRRIRKQTVRLGRSATLGKTSGCSGSTKIPKEMTSANAITSADSVVVEQEQNNGKSSTNGEKDLLIPGEEEEMLAKARGGSSKTLQVHNKDNNNGVVGSSSSGNDMEMIPLGRKSEGQPFSGSGANTATPMSVTDNSASVVSKGTASAAEAASRPKDESAAAATSAVAKATAPPPAPSVRSSTKLSVSARFNLVQTAVVTANDARRRVESNLAAIMMGYVLVFLICHAPRLLLNIHELANIRKVPNQVFNFFCNSI